MDPMKRVKELHLQVDEALRLVRLFAGLAFSVFIFEFVVIGFVGPGLTGAIFIASLSGYAFFRVPRYWILGNVVPNSIYHRVYRRNERWFDLTIFITSILFVFGAFEYSGRIEFIVATFWE